MQVPKTKTMYYRKVPRVWFFKVLGQRERLYIDKMSIPRRTTMVLPVPGRMMVSRREEKKSPWASLGAVIALASYLVKFPEDRW
jgi:hypothetical protein